jgi:hypothetical protein
LQIWGAERLSIASPYYDDTALQELCERLHVSQVLLHAHPGGTVEGISARNWPDNASALVSAACLDRLREENPRRLHAKLFEVVCRRGRLLLSGSANATMAALGPSANVEVSVARVERGHVVPWAFNPAMRPAPTVVPEDQDDAESSASVRVLCADFTNDVLRGTVLQPYPVGEVTVEMREGGPWIACGTATVSASGEFSLSFGLTSSWSGGPLVIRLRSFGGVTAQGIVSQPEMREITRRLGPRVRSFMAVLHGMETPKDIAEVLSYFQEHPEDLLRDPRVVSPIIPVSGPQSDTMISVNETEDSQGGIVGGTGCRGNSRSKTWITFLQV